MRTEGVDANIVCVLPLFFGAGGFGGGGVFGGFFVLIYGAAFYVSSIGIIDFCPRYGA